MGQNKKMWKGSGRNVHKFLMKESFRKLQNEGYNVTLEKKICHGRIDVFGEKDGKSIGIECSVRPTLQFIKNKIRLYSKQVDKLILCYPSRYSTKFPIESFIDSIKVEIPEYLSEKTFLKDTKTSPEATIKLKELQSKNKNLLIALVRISKYGQKIVTIPTDSEIQKDDYVEIIKLI